MGPEVFEVLKMMMVILCKRMNIYLLPCALKLISKQTEVRDCLRAYKLDANEKSDKSAFNKFTKDVLIKTLTFLNVNDEKKTEIAY